MRALVYEGPERLHVRERPDPEPEPGGVVVRVLACGICGTDLRIAKGGHRAYPPGTRRIPGHEIVAEVVALGDGVADGLTAGDRVFVSPNLGCGRCPACRAGRPNLCVDAAAFGITFDGGFAELMAVPAAAVAQGNLLSLPDTLEPATASAVEPLACVLRGQRAVGVGEGDRVLVCGAGPIGLLHVLLARAAGARVIVSEPHERRRRQAGEFGAEVLVDPDSEDLQARVMEATGGAGADVVITAVPVAAVQEQALALAAVGGRINFFGGLPRGASTIALDSNLVHYRELHITGTTANDTGDCRRALELSAGGGVDLRRLVTARFGIEEGARAFAAAAGGAELKVVIEP